MRDSLLGDLKNIIQQVLNLYVVADSGSGIEKFVSGIRDKHPGSATLYCTVGTTPQWREACFNMYIVQALRKRIIMFFSSGQGCYEAYISTREKA
jgi:hypothetical protein